MTKYTLKNYERFNKYTIKNFIAQIQSKKCYDYNKCGDTTGCKGYELRCSGYSEQEAEE
jgi:hypothetical protein